MLNSEKSDIKESQLSIATTITIHIGDNFTLSSDGEPTAQVRADGKVALNNVTQLDSKVFIDIDDDRVAETMVPAQGKVSLNVIGFAKGSGAYQLTVEGTDADGDKRHGTLTFSVV